MTQEQGPQNQLSPEVLSSLGLTLEIAARIDPETQRRHAILQVIEQNGRSLYKTLSYDGVKRVHEVQLYNYNDLYVRDLGDHKHDDPFLRLVPDKLTRLGHFGTEFQKMPDALFGQLEEYSPDNTPAWRNFHDVLFAFCRGYGNAALENGDYVTAVNALDVAYHGILSDASVMARLKDIAKTDEVAGVRIAQAIQARISRQDTQTPPRTGMWPTIR